VVPNLKSRNNQIALFHWVGGAGVGFLISAIWGNFLVLGIILVLISLVWHIWFYFAKGF